MAALCATGLVAAPGDHQATLVNRSKQVWELQLAAHGRGILVVTVTAKGGQAVSYECPPGQRWLIELRPREEVTLSFRESKAASRSATLGERGALEEQSHGLYLQDGPTGLLLAATMEGPFRQKGRVLEIQARESSTCTIL